MKNFKNLNLQLAYISMVSNSLLLRRSFSSNCTPISERIVPLSFSQVRSSLGNPWQISPWFITGFTDGEGCFFIEIRKSNLYKVGFAVLCGFQISLHIKDQALLEGIQSSLGGVGKISKQRKDSVQWRVRSVKDLKVIIDHFDKYPLVTQKRADYELFKQVFDFISKEEHLTSEGFNKILSIKASINDGLSTALSESFPNVIPVPRRLVVGQQVPDPDWFVGFVAGEGCFSICTTFFFFFLLIYCIF